MGKVVYLNNQVTKEFMEQNNISPEPAKKARKNNTKVVELKAEKKTRKKKTDKKSTPVSNNDYNGPDAG